MCLLFLEHYSGLWFLNTDLLQSLSGYQSLNTSDPTIIRPFHTTELTTKESGKSLYIPQKSRPKLWEKQNSNAELDKTRRRNLCNCPKMVKSDLDFV